MHRSTGPVWARSNEPDVVRRPPGGRNTTQVNPPDTSATHSGRTRMCVTIERDCDVHPRIKAGDWALILRIGKAPAVLGHHRVQLGGVISVRRGGFPVLHKRPTRLTNFKRTTLLRRRAGGRTTAARDRGPGTLRRYARSRLSCAVASLSSSSWLGPGRGRGAEGRPASRGA
jgi:hypothetical protein